jgi:multiple sugar transport system permease protein
MQLARHRRAARHPGRLPARRAGSRPFSRERLTPFLYLLPTLILLIVFDLWPILLGFWISLWRWGVTPERFVGLANYRRLWDETIRIEDGSVLIGDLGQSFLVTLYFVIGTIPATLALSFLVANLLYQKIRGRAFFRAAFFLPHVTSTVAVGMVFLWIFNPQVGVANAILRRFGLPAQTWLQDPDPVLMKIAMGLGLGWPTGFSEKLAGPSMALFCVILFSIWASVGFNTVILLAGLSAIQPELYEAARLDGATAWQLMRRITLPLLSPTLFFLLTISVIGAFQTFEAVYILSGGGGSGSQAGGPLRTTTTLTLYIFDNFYQRPSAVGYAAAASFLLFAFLLGLTALQFRFVERRVFYA